MDEEIGVTQVERKGLTMGWLGIYEILRGRDYEALAEFLKDSEDTKAAMLEACEQIAVDEAVKAQKPGEPMKNSAEDVKARKMEIYTETLGRLKELGYEHM